MLTDIRSEGIGAIMKRPGVLFLTILILGFVFHIVMSALIHYSTVDSSTEGLMALNILEGDRPLFFYGQNYLSAIEAYLAAILFWLFGPSELTLSLAPIIFYLGWLAGTYFLFRDLVDHKAGLAAALVLVFPGWYTLWFNISSYGGYPGAFCFGTWAVWLCLRIANRELSPKAEWAHILPLGFLAGIALWTNYQTAPYLLMGSVLLLPYLIRIRFAPRVLGKFAVAGGLFIAGIWPVIISYAKYEYKPIAHWNMTRGYIKHTTNIMSDRCLPRLFFWPIDMPAVLKWIIIICFVMACCLYIWRVLFASDRRDRCKVLLPLLFPVIFLILYLPHTMASLGAPRYLISPWSMILFAVFAVPVTVSKPGLRRFAWGLLAIWLAYNAASAVLLAREKAPEKRAKVAERFRIVEKAQRIEAKTVIMVGGHVFGQNGQALTFYANGEIHFVSAFDPRYQPSAQAAEADPCIALACEKPRLKKVKTTLDELNVDYRVEEDSRVCLLYDLTVTRTEKRSVPTSDMRITPVGRTSGNGGHLVDRIRETYMHATYDGESGFTIDLGKERVLDSIWLTSPDRDGEGLFDRYSISASSDGEEYRTIREVDKRLPVAYTCGDHVYLMGYFGLLECRFEPVSVRYLRVRCRSAKGDKNWRISEIFVFEKKDGTPGDLENEVKEIASTIKKLNIDFTICDRWLSARLWTLLPSTESKPPVYPRFNPRHTSTLLSRRIQPRKGIAIVPCSAVADECVMLLRELYGDEVIDQRIDFSNYTVLVLNDAEVSVDNSVALIWNGHTLLKTRNPEAGIYIGP